MKTDKEFEKQFRRQEWWSSFSVATDTQVFPYRATILIWVLGFALHINYWYLVLIWFGYFLGDTLELAAKIRRLNAAQLEVMEQQESWDKEMSEEGLPFPREHRVVVNQVAQFLRRML